MGRARRRFLVVGTFALASAAAVACGLDLAGRTTEAGDGGAPDVLVRPAEGAIIGAEDATSPPAMEGGADATADASCASDAGFCDVCDRDLVLCLRFDGGVRDESAYGRPISIDGGPLTFVVDRGRGALSLDGGTSLVAAFGEELRDLGDYTFELVLRPERAPAPGQRYSLIDREGVAGLHLYGGQAGGGPFVRCHGVDADAGALREGWLHLVCVERKVAGGGSSLDIYVDGGDLTLDRPVASTAPTERAIFLLANDPDGNDAFVGDVMSIRIHRRAKSRDEIRDAAAR